MLLIRNKSVSSPWLAERPEVQARGMATWGMIQALLVPGVGQGLTMTMPLYQWCSDDSGCVSICIFCRENGHKEDKRSGDKSEIRKETCSQCQTGMESWGAQGTHWPHVHPLSRLQSLALTPPGLCHLPGSSLDGTDDTDSPILEAGEVHQIKDTPGEMKTGKCHLQK